MAAFNGLTNSLESIALLSKARSVGSGARTPFAATVDELRKDRELLQRTLADTEPVE